MTPAEQRASGSAVSGPAVSGPAVSGPAVSGPAVSGPAVSGPAVSGPAVSGPAVSGPAVSGPAVSGPAVAQSAAGPAEPAAGVGRGRRDETPAERAERIEQARAERAERFAENAARVRAAAEAQLPPLTVDPIGDRPNQVSAWNIANGLTVLRLALVPVFVWTLFAHGGHADGWRVVAWAVFALACITDTVDGDIARKRGLVTEFGKLADPIADKALIGSALIGLSLLGDLPWWVTVVILVRELGVTLLRFWVIRHGVIPASRGGKLKTLLQGIAIGLFVLPDWGWLHGIAWVVMIAAIVVTLATAADYVARALALRRSPREHPAAPSR